MVRAVLSVLVFSLVMSACNAFISTASDAFARGRSVKLVGGGGSCSGEQVVAPSGQHYILTAGHCKDLRMDKNSITVETEDGRVLERAIVAEDMKSDLLLLEGVPTLRGLQIADAYKPAQHVRTFTHGAGLPTYETEGVLVGKAEEMVLLGFIGLTYNGACKGAKYRIVPVDYMGGQISACVLDVIEMVSTAMVVPGSSGGMVVDDNGNLVGVVSATDGHFSYMITLDDIKAFLAGY